MKELTIFLKQAYLAGFLLKKCTRKYQTQTSNISNAFYPLLSGYYYHISTPGIRNDLRGKPFCIRLPRPVRIINCFFFPHGLPIRVALGVIMFCEFVRYFPSHDSFPFLLFIFFHGYRVSFAHSRGA